MITTYQGPAIGGPRALLLRLAEVCEVKFIVNDAKPGFVDYTDRELLSLLEAELTEMYLAIAHLGPNATVEERRAAVFEIGDVVNCLAMLAHAKGLLGDDLDGRGRLRPDPTG